MARYLTPAETAKILRGVLKKRFPGITFSVRKGGGQALDVRWTDGPTANEVKEVTWQFEGQGFDGSIDMAYHKEHWLRPDGSILLRHTPGTEGSAGTVPSEDNRDLSPVIPKDAEEVQFGTNFVFPHRDRSREEERVTEAVDWLYQNVHIDNPTGDPTKDRFGYDQLLGLARNMVGRQAETESLSDVFKRSPHAAPPPWKPHPQKRKSGRKRSDLGRQRRSF